MKRIKGFFSRLWDCTPTVSRVFIVAAAISVPLLIMLVSFPKFADLYNRYPAALFKGMLATLTGWLPISFAEIILILLLPTAVFLIVLVFKVSKKSNRQMVKMCMSLLSVLCFMFSSFVLSFGSGYHVTSLDKKLHIEPVSVNADSLKTTAEALLEELNILARDIEFQDKSFSVMPYSVSDMNDILQRDLIAASDKYEFLPSFRTNLKPVMLSKPMTYTHISGVYSFFTGEANLNTNFPDYTLPYTAAHELSHQRGIAREDEANFMAFLVCKDSEDSYVRYSGYMSMLEYVLSALYKTDTEAYYEVMYKTDVRFQYEMIAFNKFFEEYEENKAADISGAVNDTYLKVQGQEAGTFSYGLVVNLAVAYYCG